MQIYKSNANWRIANILSVIGGVLILDRFLKMLVAAKVKTIEIIPGFFQIVFYQNTKGPFSLPIPQIVIISVTLLILIVIVILIYPPAFLKTLQFSHKVGQHLKIRTPPAWFNTLQKGGGVNKKPNLRIPLLLITAGALSNLFDRIFYGYTIDTFNFLNFSFFNLADGLIIFGISFLVFNLFKKRTT